MFASVGGKVGLQAVGRHEIRGVTVPDAAPTSERNSAKLPDCDQFFYSGHGMRAAGQSGLLLVDDEAYERLFAEDDILAIPALRHKTVIVLSAYETATGGQASAELSDVGSSFLRIGAKFVVGTLWVVVEDCANAFTTDFYSALEKGEDPELSIWYGLARPQEAPRRSGIKHHCASTAGFACSVQISTISFIYQEVIPP